MSPADPHSAGRHITAEKAERLLGVLCVTYGFCLHSPEYDDLCDSPPESPRAFLDAVFRAEGFSLETADLNMYRAMLKEVQMAFDDFRQ